MAANGKKEPGSQPSLGRPPPGAPPSSPPPPPTEVSAAPSSERKGWAQATPPEFQEIWEQHGRRNPMGFVLPAPGGRHERWEEDAFLATGRRSIQTILNHLAIYYHLPERSVALDFGCGPGRLSQALAEHFAQVYGVDVAPSMLAAARAINRHGGRCRYLLNQSDDLRMFGDGSVDFVVADIVLQHLRPACALGYVREMLRVLGKGGILVFFLPGRRIKRGWAPFLISAYNRVRYGAYTTLNYGVDPKEVEETIEASGGRLLERNGKLTLDRGDQVPGARPGLVDRVWGGVTLVLTDHFEGWIYLVEKVGPP